MSATTLNPLTLRNRIHPQVFGLYIAFGSIIMMFGALTSAYIVKHASGGWLEFTIPNFFYYSTAVLVLSSITLHYSYTSFRKRNERPYKLFLIASLILGLTFVVLQYFGWTALFAKGAALLALR